MPKNERRSLRILNGLEIAGSSPTAPWRETGSGCNTAGLASESAPVAPRGIIEPGSLKAQVKTSCRNMPLFLFADQKPGFGQGLFPGGGSACFELFFASPLFVPLRCRNGSSLPAPAQHQRKHQLERTLLFEAVLG
jgi:hypothetical protein